MTDHATPRPRYKCYDRPTNEIINALKVENAELRAKLKKVNGTAKAALARVRP